MAKAKPARTTSPAVRQLIAIIDRKGGKYHAVCASAGVYQHALTNWKHGAFAPNLLAFEAIVESLGYRLEIVPISHGSDGTEQTG